VGRSCQSQSLGLHCLPDADGYATSYATTNKLHMVVLQHVKQVYWAMVVPYGQHRLRHVPGEDVECCSQLMCALGNV
jgi:hypothetical protein